MNYKHTLFFIFFSLGMVASMIGPILPFLAILLSPTTTHYLSAPFFGIGALVGPWLAGLILDRLSVLFLPLWCLLVSILFLIMLTVNASLTKYKLSASQKQ